MELSKHNSQRLTRNFSSLARRCHNHDRDHWFHSSPSTSSQAAALFSTAPSTPTSSHATDDEDEPSSGMTNPSYKDEIINSFRRDLPYVREEIFAFIQEEEERLQREEDEEKEEEAAAASVEGPSVRNNG